MRNLCRIIFLIPFVLGTKQILQAQQEQETIHLTEDTIIRAETMRAISWMPDGRGLAYLSNEVIIVDLLPDFRAMMLPNSGAPMSLAWHPDGEQLAVLGDLPSVWDVEEKAYSRIRFTPDGYSFGSNMVDWNASGDKILLFAREIEGQSIKLRVYDQQSRTVINVGDDLKTLTHAAFWQNTDDRILRWDGNEFEIWEVADDHTQSIRSFEISDLRLDAVDLSSDDRWLVASGRDSDGIYLLVWDMVSEQVVYQIGGINNPVTALDWHPQHAMFATGHIDGTVQLWSVAEGIHRDSTYACSQDGDIPFINAIDWSPDGSRLACGSADGTLMIWRLD